MENRLRQHFANMVVYKEPQKSRFFSTLSLPSFIRDWLVMRFAAEDGTVDFAEVSDFVSNTIPKRDKWESLKYEIIHEYRTTKFLAKVKVETDVSTRKTYFSLPDFGWPKKKAEAIVAPRVLQAHKDYLVTPADIWGVVELRFGVDDGKNVMEMSGFQPFCPYDIDVQYFTAVRDYFTIEEWIDILLGAIDYNPKGFIDNRQKLTMISRLIPFVEPRTNLIELAPKGTGKSYMFSQISKYGWLVSGGSITRAKLFYDVAKRTPGLIAHYDFLAFDEIQSIVFSEPAEIVGALKGYLENGQFRVGDYSGNGEAGLILLGNIDMGLMNPNADMFSSFGHIITESALLDRFHGFIKGWDIPRMSERMKANGWALNVEYFTEIVHLLRADSVYRLVVDELLDVPKNSDTRDTEAIKRITTAHLKLLFPNWRQTESVDLPQFEQFCLQPAIEMRRVIKQQMAIMDVEFSGKGLPDIKVRDGSSYIG